MNTLIRPYQESDFEEICSWWCKQNELPPLPGMMCANGTFVTEYEDEPVMTLTALMTQSKEISFIEGYCAKPGLDAELRRTIGESIWNHCFNFLRSNGMKRVIAFTDKQSLVNRYKHFGMTENISGLVSLGRIL
jgi:hypothetical protein